MVFGHFLPSAPALVQTRKSVRGRKAVRIGVAVLALGFLAACQGDEFASGPNKHKAPVSSSIKRKMTDLNMSSTSPIMIRIFKEESELEVWKKTRSGKYRILEEFEICKWSGDLGPKFKEGDRQAPEGFYEITPALMNPNSSYHLAFNLGYPNKYDRSHGRTGSHLMVHGACSSRGCYAMTDEQVQDIYALARDSFKGGQRSFQVQAYPFRMTAENMARHRNSEHIEFWNMLKNGYDHFEVTKAPPKIDVCEQKYVFDATTLVEGVPFRASAQCPVYEVNPRIEQSVAQKQRLDDEKYQKLAAKFDARDARQRRREERQVEVAETEIDDAEVPVETATAEAPVPEVATPSPGSAVETAYVDENATKKNPVGGFFKRWAPFGPKAAEAGIGPISTEVVPAAKP
ncbi:MAG: murein L,D-transpeptidase family protein [Roseibium sp.]